MSDPATSPMAPFPNFPVVIDGARNRRVAAIVVVFVGVMLALAFAAVPLYDLFCRVTGYGGTPRFSQTAPEFVDTRVFKMRFDVNVAKGLGWRFEAENAEIEISAGEVHEVAYTLRNLSDRPTTGIASFNVTPEQVGVYFNKIDCFCFVEQQLAPGESRSERVIFFVDPAISEQSALDSIRTITLSYTFFPALSAAPTSK